MKHIVLMPVRNEVELLSITLPAISSCIDVIIIADQMSDDGSRDIYKKFPKIQVIDNNRVGHSNEVRWDLLEAARNYDGENLLMLLDADEYIPPVILKNFIREKEFISGVSFRFPWIQLWRGLHQYNTGGVWKNNFKPIAWVDDRKNKYDMNIVLNDHTSRIPSSYLTKCELEREVPIIHLQWVYWHRTRIKQAWYICSELIKNPLNYKKINRTYSVVSESMSFSLNNTPPQWLEGVDFPPHLENLSPSWQLQAIYCYFDKYGIEFFEPLQIWDIKEFSIEFKKRTGRYPKPFTDSTIYSNFHKVSINVAGLLKGLKYGI